MPIIRLVLQGGGANTRRRPPIIFTSTNLGRGYFPTRGLLHSLVVHGAAFVIVYFFASFPSALQKRPLPRENIVMIDLNDPLSLMYLPMFDGGPPAGSGQSIAGRKVSQGGRAGNVAPSTTTQGLSYPGPQTIISDVPEPTNTFQTVLQPGLENPPVLKPPILIPNIVQVADSGAKDRMEEPPEEPRPEEPPPANTEAVPAEQPKPEPKPPEPAPKPAETPKPPPPPPKPEQKPPEPAPKPVETPKPAPPPKPVETPKQPVAAPKPEPVIPEPAPKPAELLKLEPKPPEPPPKPAEMPKPPEPAPKPVETPKPEPKPPPPLPKPSETQKPPETDSKHADSAKPEPKTSKPAPKPVETQPPQQASARQPAVEPSKETSESAATPGATRDVLSLSPMPAAPGQAGAIPTGEARGRFVISPQANLSGSDTEPGFKTGTPSPEIGIGNTTSGAPARKGVAPKTAPTASPGKGPNTGSAAAKSGADGSDAGTNAGRNSGSGTGSGSGNGSSSGSGKKPFAGITIVGGEYEPGTDRDSPPVVPAVRPLQTAYSLSIISTEDSGGGLPFYGVFSHEQIYTVYLDMRTVETDQDPSWTLEFAVSQNPPAPAAVQNISRNQQGFVLPFPSTKEKPAWPAGLARRYLGKMMVVYGLVNTGGKMEQISIKETPDAQLNEPVVRALSKWVFRPATLEGQPVSAKALMGIPIWSPE